MSVFFNFRLNGHTLSQPAGATRGCIVFHVYSPDVSSRNQFRMRGGLAGRPRKHKGQNHSALSRRSNKRFRFPPSGRVADSLKLPATKWPTRRRVAIRSSGYLRAPVTLYNVIAPPGAGVVSNVPGAHLQPGRWLYCRYFRPETVPDTFRLNFATTYGLARGPENL